jgi:hypothetical protein
MIDLSVKVETRAAAEARQLQRVRTAVEPLAPRGAAVPYPSPCGAASGPPRKRSAPSRMRLASFDLHDHHIGA